MVQKADIEHTTETQWYDCSDHCVIFSVLELPNARPQATHIRLPNAPAALQLCTEAAEVSATPEEFLAEHRRMASMMLHVRRIRLSLRQKQEQMIPDLAGFARLIDGYLRSNESKEAFRLINRLSIVHPTKRDGGIMNCFLSADGVQLVVGQEPVLLSCLEILQRISGEAPPHTVHDLNFPTLPALTLEEVQWLQYGCSWGKGHTPDGFSDVWIRCTDRRELLADLWNPRALRQLGRCFEARLVPLNKAWPDIPAVDQFRPIVVLSPLYKFLERRFERPL